MPNEAKPSDVSDGEAPDDGPPLSEHDRTSDPNAPKGSVDMDPNTLRFWREDPRAVIPTRSHPSDSGLDLRAIETRTLRPGARHLFDIGLRIALPRGCEGQVRPRSGLAVKHGITVLNAPGTVDENYRGRMKVILLNTGSENFLVEEGKTRIAQLVVVPVTRFDPVEVHGEDALGKTDRGEGGFGSTGS